MSDELQSGPDLAAIADRMYGAKPATEAAAEAPPAVATAQPATEAAPADPRELRRQAEDIERATRAQQATSEADKALQEKYPDVPLEVAKLRDAPERRMYYADTFKTSVDTKAAIAAATNVIDLKKMTGVDMTPEQLAEIAPKVATELHAIYTDVGLTTEEAQRVEAVIVDVRTNKPDAAGDAANATDALRQLSERYGADADQALADARAFIARDPRIGRIMDMSRAGNDPRMVLLAVEAARRARSRGEKF